MRTLLLISLGCMTLLGSGGDNPTSDIAAADQLFQKQEYQGALGQYQTVLSEAEDRESREKALFRACQCLTMLRRFGEATELLTSREAPQDMPHRARFLMLEAEILGKFVERYSRVLRGDVIEEEGKEVFRLTPDELKAMRAETYLALWEIREALAATDLRAESYFIDTTTVDFARYPTLLDYIILAWTRALLNGEIACGKGAATPDAGPVLVEQFTRDVDLNDPQGLLVAEILEATGALRPDFRREAIERWRIARVMLPLEHQQLFDLTGLSGHPGNRDPREDLEVCRETTKQILLTWLEGFRSDEARAWAGYQAAVIMHAQTQYAPAVEVCGRIADQLPGTEAAALAQQLRANIEAPAVEIAARTVMPPGKRAFTVTTRNLSELYFRAYTIEPWAARNAYERIAKVRRSESYRYKTWGDFLEGDWLDDDDGKIWLFEYLLTRKPLVEWSITTGDSGDYKECVNTVSPPPLGTGVYLVTASDERGFREGNPHWAVSLLNVTNLVVIGDAGPTTSTLDRYYRALERDEDEDGTDEVFHFYAFDAASGRPAAHAKLIAGVYPGGDYLSLAETFNADWLGRAGFSTDITVRWKLHNRLGVDLVAHGDGSFACLSDMVRLDYSPPNPLSVFVETDRPIYQPGDSTRIKAIVVKSTRDGFRCMGGATSITVGAKDANGKEFFKQTLALGPFGSASTAFEIPRGRLLGRYNLEVACAYKSWTAKTSAGFSVEEYKRPEFEIVLEPADRPWKHGEEARVKGRAAYYFGGPVPDAKVSYVITRRAYHPCWWWADWYGNRGGTEVVRGEVETDQEGSFSIAFTPVGSPIQGRRSENDISRFTVRVEGHDSGGRTIEETREYRAGASSAYILIEPAKGFFSEREAIEIESQRLTLNDTPAPGPGSFQVFSLSDMPADTTTSLEPGWEFAGRSEASLDDQLESVPNGEKVAGGSVEHAENGKATIRLEPLAPGTYRFLETSPDDWGASVTSGRVFVVAGTREVKVPARSVTLVEKDEYQVGETARFVIGSCRGSGIYHVEIWGGEYLLGRRLVYGDAPVSQVEIIVTQKMKGGFTVRWFGVKDLKIQMGQTTVSVPWKEKQLQVALQTGGRALKPGTQYTWGINLADAQGRPVRGEVLALMYDRSLEYYAVDGRPWLDGLYALRRSHLWHVHSIFNPRVVFPYADERYTSAPRVPEHHEGSDRAPFILIDPWDHARVVRLMKYTETIGAAAGITGESPVLMSQDQLHVRGGRAGETKFYVDGLDISDPFAAGGPDLEKTAGEARARAEFRDAVFFEPHIVTSPQDGAASLTFTVPDQVTSWRVKVFAFTDDVAHGTLVQEVETRKDLMVRADLPRFLREGDEATLTAVVHNESDEAIAGQVFIAVTDGGTDVGQRIGLEERRRDFSVAPHGLQTHDWNVVVPQGVATYRVRVAAATAALSDAEERDLPVLPSRERLIESAFVVLSGTETKRLGIALKADPTRINEAMVLEIEPQLALTVLNTIPFLVQCPYECVEQTLNKYVPLSIISKVYAEFPAIRQAVGQIPKRTTPTPPWQVDDPRRLVALMETPWMWQSEGHPLPWPLIDLLNPDNVRDQAATRLSRLESAQLSSGAFPWWPGGEADLYMTLYVLEGLAEAHRYGVEVPERIATHALRYVTAETPKMLEADTGNLAMVSFAAYVLTSYPEDLYPQARKGHALAKQWIGFLEDHLSLLTPFGKARLAYTHFNLGNPGRAGEVLDLAMEGTREDAISGVYWTPEKYSWVWYSDTVEKHAFLLRALHRIRPDDRRIPGMVQWLLFNRKGTVWKSTKASAAAIYAILDFMKQRGALESDEVFATSWGDLGDSIVVRPDQWLAEPLRWQAAGPEITPSMADADVAKRGPGLAFASLTWTYSTDQIPEASQPGMLALERRFYRRVWESGAYHLKPLKSGDQVQVGDQIEVQLKVVARAQFEYMHLKDPKASGFEAEALMSGWKHDALAFYEEPRHSLTNFFMSRVPHGEYILRYRLRPTKPGTYRIGAATLQSMYAPEMTAHSAGFAVNVVK